VTVAGGAAEDFDVCGTPASTCQRPTALTLLGRANGLIEQVYRSLL
jgi:hypothetical protein